MLVCPCACVFVCVCGCIVGCAAASTPLVIEHQQQITHLRLFATLIDAVHLNPDSVSFKEVPRYVGRLCNEEMKMHTLGNVAGAPCHSEHTSALALLNPWPTSGMLAKSTSKMQLPGRGGAAVGGRHSCAAKKKGRHKWQRKFLWEGAARLAGMTRCGVKPQDGTLERQ